MKSSRSDIIKYIFILFVIILAVITYVVYQKTTSKANEPQAKKEEEEYNIIKGTGALLTQEEKKEIENIIKEEK